MLTDLLLAQGTWNIPIGWWMALIMFATFLPWGWLVSSRLDKDARFYHLNHQMWNGIHLGCGFAALLAMLFIPLIGLGWLVGVIILLTPILIYWRQRNAVVPEMKKFYLSGSKFGDRMQERKLRRASSEAVLQFTAPNGQKIQVPTKDDPRFPIHMMTEDLIAPALEVRSSRVELVVTDKGANVYQVVDGVAQKRDPLPAQPALQLVDFIKTMAGMDVSDRRRKQIARFHMSGPTGNVELDATTSGSSAGIRLRIDFNRADRLVLPFDGLGLLPSQIKSLEFLKEKHQHHGIVLVGAPRGQGLTTTAYSFVNRHDAYTSNIKSLEMEVQARLDGVDQVKWDASNPDVDYATSLQSILRRDPDIVLTDVIETPEVAKIAAEPGMQGPLIYVQQRHSNIVDQIRDWVKLVGDVKGATRAMRAVTNQRTLRTLCTNCRQSFTPTAEQLQRLGLNKDKVQQLYRASGKVQVKNQIVDCPICQGTGYLGQTAVYEVMIVDDDIRRILASGDLKAALAHARRNHMIYLQEAALAKVVSGETTIEEVIRVTAPPKPAGGSNKDESAAAPAPAPKEPASSPGAA